MLATETIALKAVVYHLYAACLVLNSGQQLDIAGRETIILLDSFVDIWVKYLETVGLTIYLYLYLSACNRKPLHKEFT